MAASAIRSTYEMQRSNKARQIRYSGVECGNDHLLSETTHQLYRKKPNRFILKVYFKKTYDRIKYTFLTTFLKTRFFLQGDNHKKIQISEVGNSPKDQGGLGILNLQLQKDNLIGK